MDTTTTTTATFESRITSLRDSLKSLEAARRATLPRMTNEERETVVAFERSLDASEDLRKEVSAIRKSTNTTDEDKDQITAARMAHRKEANTDAAKDELCARLKRSYISSLKYTHRKDGRLGVSVRATI